MTASRSRQISMSVNLTTSIVLALIAAINPVQSQNRDDLIGSLTKTSTFDRAQRINVGKSSKGKPVCFFREEGGSHMLDIGISRDGAFIRVAHGDGPLRAEEIPSPPLRLFAGKAMTKVVDGDEKITGEYEPLLTYGGSIDYVPNLVTDFGNGFAVVSEGDPESFLGVVARARGEFAVVQSASEPKKLDVVAIYDFKTASVSALLSCAKSHVR